MVNMVTFLTLMSGFYGLIMLLIIYIAFPYPVKRLMYKKRAKKAFYLDTRELKVVVLNKERTTFKHNGLVYTWVPAKEYDNLSFYDSTISEPVEMGPIEVNLNLGKCDYYINSQEYTNVIENTLLEQFMGADDLKDIKKIMYLVIGSVGLNLYLIMKLQGLDVYLHAVVQQAATAAGIPLV